MRVSLVLLALASPAAAVAADTPPEGTSSAPPAPSARAASAAEKPICREETVPNSRFTHKTCHSKAEWKEIDKANARHPGW